MHCYGANWQTEDQIAIELGAIKNGGHWENRQGKICGMGLSHHFKALQSLLAPWKQWDRWSELILKEIIVNRMTILTGPASSTKTHNMAFYGLCAYILNPTNQCVLISSTDTRSLELRIWGELKKLWSAARAKFEGTPGRIVESKQMIVTEIEEDEATDYRNGVIAIPCMVGGNFVGLGKYAGIKNGNVLLLADELSYMSPAFYDAISNLRKNPGFKCVGSGNPKDRTDVLGKLAEPALEVGGWEGYEPTGKTFVYPTRFEDGKAICLDGRDTPNNDYPNEEKPHFPYIITREDVQRDVDYYGEDSIQVSMFDYGTFPRDAQAKRVITRSLCERYGALEDVTWSHEPLIKLFALDAAYGAVGGDRCVGVELHLGRCVDGIMRLAFGAAPMVIPVSNRLLTIPEDQIALWVKNYCEHPSRNIQPHHVAFDSTGRGSLVSAFGRLWSTAVIAIEFGGHASDRMVSSKIQVKCREYYANFVTELWYQTRTLIESDQIRKMPTSIMEEGCMRAFDIINRKIVVEPKDKLKLRMNRSPDLYDSFAVGAELARRNGLAIRGLARAKIGTPSWLQKMATSKVEMIKRKQLKY